MLKKFRRMAGVLGVGAVLLLGGAPAVAATDNGAQTYNETYCEDYIYFEMCITLKSMYQITRMPNGSQSYATNGEYLTTATYDDGSVFSNSAKFNLHTLSKPGEEPTARYDYVQTVANPSQTCTYTTTFTYVNGVTRGFEEFSTTCV